MFFSNILGIENHYQHIEILNVDAYGHIIVYMYTFIYVYMFIYVYICVYIYIYMCVYIYK